MSYLIVQTLRTANSLGRRPQHYRVLVQQTRFLNDKSDDVKFTKTTKENSTSTSSPNDMVEQILATPTNTPSAKPEGKKSDKLGGFAKAFEEFSQLGKEPKPPIVENLPFSKLLRTSKMVDLGDPKGKMVSGTIIHIVDNDMYIDFGWKFYCVCTRPQKNGDMYVRGAKVRLRINELELSTRFLGEEKDLTILEADCKLFGLIWSPKWKQTEQKSESAQ